MPWQVVASREIGSKHLQQGKPCQDSVKYEILADYQITIGAVSDGMGSAKYSELGSQLAVDVAIAKLRKEEWKCECRDENSTRKFFGDLLYLTQDLLKRKAGIQGCKIQDLACTLLVFIATPKWLAAMQIGDGAIVVRASNEEYQLLFKPEKGEFINETRSITSSKALAEMQVCLKPISYQFICASTDGIEDMALIKQENWKPFDKFFIPLERLILSNLHSAKKKAQLDGLLKSEKISRNTDDDVTLLLCAYLCLPNPIA